MTTSSKARHLVNGQTVLVTNKWWDTEDGPLIPATRATARKWVREAEVVSVERMDNGRWCVTTSEGAFTTTTQQTFQVVTTTPVPAPAAIVPGTRVKVAGKRTVWTVRLVFEDGTAYLSRPMPQSRQPQGRSYRGIGGSGTTEHTTERLTDLVVVAP